VHWAPFLLSLLFCVMHGDGPKESARPCALQSIRRGICAAVAFEKVLSSFAAQRANGPGCFAVCERERQTLSACLRLGRRALCRAQRAAVPPGLGAHGPAGVCRRRRRRRRRPLWRDPGQPADRHSAASPATSCIVPESGATARCAESSDAGRWCAVKKMPGRSPGATQ